MMIPAMNDYAVSTPSLPLEKYKIEKEIGRGAYGVVHEVKDPNTDGVYALKVLKFERSNNGLPHSVIREMASLMSVRHLKHANIITLINAFIGNDDLGNTTLSILYEKCDWDLYDFLKNIPRHMGNSQCKWFSFQILAGLEFLHNNSLIHRDMKPQNILVNKDQTIRIADFGLVRNYSLHSTFTTTVVTLWYRAPELLLQCGYNTAVDIWSAGCIILELFSREALFPVKTETEMLYSIMDPCRMAPEVAAQLARLEAVDAEVSSRAGAVLREWVAAGQAIGPLVDHYVRVKSTVALAVLAGVKEPYDEVLINKINDTFRRNPLEALGLLLRLMQFAPPWLRHVPKYSLFTALVERLKYDKIKTHADVELAVGILNLLAGLVPHCIDITTAQLERFFLAFTKGAVLYTTIMQNQMVAPSNFDVSITRVQASAVYEALTNFFEFVYATYPCNFAEFIRKQNQAYPSRTFVLRVLEPMSKSMRLNPKLFTGSCQKELVRGGFEEAFGNAESLGFHDVPQATPSARPSLSTTSSSSSLRLNPPPTLGSVAVPISTAPEWSPLEDLPLRPMTYTATGTVNSVLSDSFRPRVSSGTMKPPPTKKVSLGERVNNFFKGTERAPKDGDIPMPVEIRQAAAEDAFSPFSSSFIDRRPALVEVKPPIEAATHIPADPIQPQKTGSKRRRCTSDPCGCRQHGSAENLDPEKYPHTFRILHSSDPGVVTDSTLSRLTSTAANIRSDYLATSATYQSTLLHHGILAAPDDELAALEGLKVDQQRDVLLMRARLQHQHLLYERYCRTISACRNTLLYDRLRDCQAIVGERDVLKEQISALKAELAAKDIAAGEAAAKMERERAEFATYESLLKSKVDDMAKERDIANSRAIDLQHELHQLLGRDAELRAARDLALREKDDLLAEYRFVNEQLTKAQLDLMKNTQLERRCQALSETVQSLTRQVLDSRCQSAVKAEGSGSPALENADLRKQVSKLRRELRVKKDTAALFPNRFDDVEWLLSVEGAMEAAFAVFDRKQAEHDAENTALRQTNAFYLDQIYKLKTELESERKHRLQGCYAGKAGFASRSPSLGDVDMSVLAGLFSNAPVAESPDNTPYYKSCIFGLDDDEVMEDNENDPADLDESMDVPKPHFAGNWGTGPTNIPKAPTANSSTFNYDAILNHSNATAAFQMQHPAAIIGYRQHGPGKPQSPPQ